MANRAIEVGDALLAGVMRASPQLRAELADVIGTDRSGSGRGQRRFTHGARVRDLYNGRELEEVIDRALDEADR